MDLGFGKFYKAIQVREFSKVFRGVRTRGIPYQGFVCRAHLVSACGKLDGCVGRMGGVGEERKIPFEAGLYPKLGPSQAK